jgi:hypothetical protein
MKMRIDQRSFGVSQVSHYVGLAVLTMLTVSVGHAQEPRAAVPPRETSSVVTPSPQLGTPNAYAAYQRESAREYLQRRAQLKTESRQERLEANRWLGYSALRPTVTSVPYHAYSPTWGAFSVGARWGYPYWYHPANLSGH